MNEDEPDDDRDLFLREMFQVEPLKSSNRIPHKAKKHTDISLNQKKESARTHSIRDNFSDFPQEDCPELLQFSRGGIQNSLLKKLRTGKIPLEDRLDLHGMTVKQARRALGLFLDECEQSANRCVLVIHGKGYSSPDNKPVIKAHINHWLRQARSVLAFTSAQPPDGGAGAVYVLLKRT